MICNLQEKGLQTMKWIFPFLKCNPCHSPMQDNSAKTKLPYLFPLGPYTRLAPILSSVDVCCSYIFITKISLIIDSITLEKITNAVKKLISSDFTSTNKDI